MLLPLLSVVNLHGIDYNFGTDFRDKLLRCPKFSNNIGTNKACNSGGLVVADSPGDMSALIYFDGGDDVQLAVVGLGQRFSDVKSPLNKELRALYRDNQLRRYSRFRNFCRWRIV